MDAVRSFGIYGADCVALLESGYRTKSTRRNFREKVFKVMRKEPSMFTRVGERWVLRKEQLRILNSHPPLMSQMAGTCCSHIHNPRP
jgi:hypothetical protein